MQTISVKASKKSSKYADAIRVIREFHQQYPRDRKAPKPMRVRVSSWELLAGPQYGHGQGGAVNSSSDCDRGCYCQKDTGKGKS